MATNGDVVPLTTTVADVGEMATDVRTEMGIVTKVLWLLPQFVAPHHCPGAQPK
jgi:hypothetical protein